MLRVTDLELRAKMKLVSSKKMKVKKLMTMMMKMMMSERSASVKRTLELFEDMKFKTNAKMSERYKLEDR